jgi:hypothetical protein
MLVLAGSEVDHEPGVSGGSGQLPETLLAVENCTWFPGDGTLWSAVASAGLTFAIMLQVLLVVPPQPAQITLKKVTAR